jgi:protein-S-isoprenylcysteine O-methyltransferase Ste14
VYAAVHSFLLSQVVRGGLEAAFGPRAYRGLFRVAFNALAVLLFLAFLGYAADQPDDWELKFSGIFAALFWLVRLAGLVLIGWSLRKVGVAHFLGLHNLRAWRGGENPSGNSIDAGGVVASGPYRWIRHPMYAGAFLFLWGNPAWTGRYLGFCLAASLYLWVGALREEKRLLNAHGQTYADYAARTPRFVPRLRSLAGATR